MARGKAAVSGKQQRSTFRCDAGAHAVSMIKTNTNKQIQTNKCQTK